MGEEIGFLSIAELQRRYAAETLRPSDVTEALLDRIARLDPQLDSFITVTAEKARAAALAADAAILAGSYLGGMHGVPYSLKNIYATAGIPTTANSRTLVGHAPTEDAATVALLENAGGVLLGKNATWEFAQSGVQFGLPWPPARNPWNTAHSPAGSSSGSGAAVAAGLVPASLGSDTGGSIRGPAAACGIAGHKPTYGLVSRRGVFPNTFSFDHAGPLARSVEDCAIVLQAIAGFDLADPASANRPVPDFRAGLGQGIAGLTIGWSPDWMREGKIGDAAGAAFEAVLGVLTGLGARIMTVKLPPLQAYSDIKNILGMCEGFTSHAPVIRERAGDFGPLLRHRVLAGATISAETYINTQRWRLDVMRESRAGWGDIDLFVLPTATGPAGVLKQMEGVSLFTDVSLMTPFSLTGQPALSVPMGFADGLPLGVQFAGRPFDDALVLQAGHAYEQATEWHCARPAMAM